MTQVSKDFKAKNSLRESNSFIIHNINKIIFNGNDIKIN